MLKIRRWGYTKKIEKDKWRIIIDITKEISSCTSVKWKKFSLEIIA
jgi:hypothetical protein